MTFGVTEVVVKAVDHIEIIGDSEPALLLTVIPIAYTSYQLGDTGSFQIEPPAKMRPAAGCFPVMKPSVSSPAVVGKP